MTKMTATTPRISQYSVSRVNWITIKSLVRDSRTTGRVALARVLALAGVAAARFLVVAGLVVFLVATTLVVFLAVLTIYLQTLFSLLNIPLYCQKVSYFASRLCLYLRPMI